MIAGREGCDVVAAGATEGVVEGALLVDSCEFAGESVSRARPWIPAGVVSLIVGREGCDGVVAGATAGVAIAEPVVIAGSIIDCGVAEGALLDGRCEFAGESVSRARR